MFEIGQAILRDYNYSAFVQHDGKIIYGIELTVTNAKKYYEALQSVERILIYHPDLQRAVRQVLEEMECPDNNPERFTTD